MQKKKLTLNKSIVSKLTNEELSKVNGGNAAYGSSKKDCTGFLCCDPDVPKLTEGPEDFCHRDHTSPLDTCVSANCP
ncbi:class I lanthipeptide [Pedobacter sp. MR2016-19]|uniref:class I lanthipeptide n=1 Tax=Pedobacter sp. MR2016-19 TaxID=2780089 RepID=UPI0018757099|nr:class I lanthipeptide [Pedobacter sp. MR2016-19]MBE5321151.1 class I lanthipeptide [Pedobacter sp. MR2016-19]